ncbi:hypothetical protein J2W91_004508 [Paenibacillus amylolyticus]|uniref:Uncharacterized protein n=1 Tax=Paenibacillus amylolyticus TaxID=1451 RepID=A0AAP5LQX6_PAEAM|nr:hypothetical protein [Paenibacillus amylolyticus]
MSFLFQIGFNLCLSLGRLTLFRLDMFILCFTDFAITMANFFFFESIKSLSYLPIVSSLIDGNICKDLWLFMVINSLRSMVAPCLIRREHKYEGRKEDYGKFCRIVQYTYNKASGGSQKKCKVVLQDQTPINPTGQRPPKLTGLSKARQGEQGGNRTQQIKLLHVASASHSKS